MSCRTSLFKSDRPFSLKLFCFTICLFVMKLWLRLRLLCHSFAGSDGRNVPNTKQWYQALNFKTSTVDEDGQTHYNASKLYNVNSLIICAMAATLEVYFWTQSKRMSENNLVTYQHLIDNARRHVFHLKACCANILSIRGRSIDLQVSERPATELR